MAEYYSLDEAMVAALTGYINVVATADPPAGCKLQIIRGGNTQDDPGAKPGGFVTIHIGDPDDPLVGHEVAGVDRMRFSASDQKSTLFGHLRELSGGAMWLYHYTIRVEYYFTNTGETRPVARGKATALNQWLRKQLEGVRADDLGIFRVGDEVFEELHVNKIFQDEGGGPPASFIWKSKIRLEALVHVG